MKATLRNYRQSPRKVRLVADAIRGKSAEEALLILGAMPKRATGALVKVLSSAVANAKENFHKGADDLMITEVRIDKGITMKRWMPRAFGRAAPIHKHTSHISLTLTERQAKGATKKEVKAEKIEKKTETKPKKTTTKKTAKTTD